MAMLDESAPRNHNQPPLEELLGEETTALQRRAYELIDHAGRAVVTDDETAGKAAVIVKMMIDHGKKIDGAREERKRPFLEGGRTVDQHFHAIAEPLVGSDPKKKLGGAAAKVAAMVDAFRREQERKADEERRRLAEEARKQRLAAEAAERARQEAEERERRAAEESARRIREAEEAAARANSKAAAEKAARERAAAEAERKAQEAAARERQLQAEIERRRAQDAAAALARQAAEVKVAPIDSGVGVKASGRKTYAAVITDLTVAIRHCRKVDEASVKEAVQKIYDKQVRAGVRDLPGANVIEDSATTFR